MIRSRRLILFYMIQEVIKSYQTFVCSCEIFDTNVPMYYILVWLWEMWKKENRKRRQKLISASWFSFPLYISQLSRCRQNLKILALIGAEKSVTENFIGEKDKWTDKGNYKQEEADSLLHNPTFVPNFKFLGAVVPEESLTKKKVYTHTNNGYWKDKNYTPPFPLYTWYTGDTKMPQWEGKSP